MIYILTVLFNLFYFSWRLGVRRSGRPSVHGVPRSRYADDSWNQATEDFTRRLCIRHYPALHGYSPDLPLPPPTLRREKVGDHKSVEDRLENSSVNQQWTNNKLHVNIMMHIGNSCEGSPSELALRSWSVHFCHVDNRSTSNQTHQSHTHHNLTVQCCNLFILRL